MRADLNLSLPTSLRETDKTGARPQALAQLRLREAAREFEALLLEQMVKEMRDATPKSELMGRERGEELFQEMLDGEFVRLITLRGGLGISDYLVRALGGETTEK